MSRHVRADGRVRSEIQAGQTVTVTLLRPALTDIPGACRYLGDVSRAKFYADILPRLGRVKIGSTLITIESLDQLIAAHRQPVGGASGDSVALEAPRRRRTAPAAE